MPCSLVFIGSTGFLGCLQNVEAFFSQNKPILVCKTLNYWGFTHPISLKITNFKCLQNVETFFSSYKTYLVF